MKRGRRLRFALVSVAAMVGGLLLYSAWRMENVEIDRAARPSRSDVATLYMTAGGSDPPYGERLVVFNTWNPIATYFPTVLFEGYCSYPSKLHWTSPTELILECAEFADVTMRREHANDFAVVYVERPSTTGPASESPSNRPIQRTGEPAADRLGR